MKKIGKVDKQKGITLLEALVATAIIGIGFVAIFQMVQYSVRSITISGERTKATYVSAMFAEDVYAFRDQTKSNKTFAKILVDQRENGLNLTCGNDTMPTYGADNSYDNISQKWRHRTNSDFIKCQDRARDRKKIIMWEVCRSGCQYPANGIFDPIFFGRADVLMSNGEKRKSLYFQVQ